MSDPWKLQPLLQALEDAPTTAWGGAPVPQGWCARALEPAVPLAGPSERTDHCLGKTPSPPRLVCPVLGDCNPRCRPFRTHGPPPGEDPLFPEAGVHEPWRLHPPSQALPDTPTTALAGPHVPQGWCARVLETAALLAGSSEGDDHRQGRTPCPPRMVCPGLEYCSPPGRPFRIHGPPPGQHPLSPHAGVTGPWRLQPPSYALQNAPTTASAVPPIPRGWGAWALKIAAPLAGPSRRTDHCLGWIHCRPRLVCPGLEDCSPPRRPFRTHRSPPWRHPLSP